MAEQLWKFVDDNGTFISENACRVKKLYFPLCNSSPIMSSLSPDLHGDIKTDFNSYLLEPASRLSLVNSKAKREFWIHLGADKSWPITKTGDEFNLEAGLLWHKTTRRNKKLGLKAAITSFIPASGEPVELMLVEITNTSARKITFTPTAAIPLFCRSAHNLHDHRHVTSLLQRVEIKNHGVVVKPTLIFDERGHRKNETNYFVLGVGTDNQPPEYIYATQEDFTGEAGDLETPDAIFKNTLPRSSNIQGKEPMAGLKFRAVTLKPKQSAPFIIQMGIAKDASLIPSIFKKFDNRDKLLESLEETKVFWQEKGRSISVSGGDKNFSRWLKWVNIQPVLRKIFGCSFLPDFDYGRGGRGWRDLWQDCLTLILQRPEEARRLLLNNFSGVRLDGSNATIIGSAPGEFIADRNNISRAWMDHGAWPLLTTHLYIHQAGDLKILLEECPYFECPSRPRRGGLNLPYGQPYKGTVLEHLLLENLIQFFNVGEHNHIRLENADWNDGLDMAAQRGESVAFSCLYAQNLKSLCALIERLPEEKFLLLKEIAPLLNDSVDYNDAQAKRALRNTFKENVSRGVSGEKISLSKADLLASLKKKADWMYRHIRRSEWLKEGFFNGYYDNAGQRVEGNTDGATRMTLTGQAFAVMSGIATDEQVKAIFSSAQKYLKDKKYGAFHLNTDFKGEQLNLGRAFSFVYGEKENGAVFSHMCVMFAYALYKRGFAREGFEVMDSLFKLSVDSKVNKIYPGLPEYFNLEGRGMYSYLTGSASWFMLTLVTQSFGVRAEFGDLLIEPKLTVEQFGRGGCVSLIIQFAGKTIEVKFFNPRKKNYGSYSIDKVDLNGKTLAEGLRQPRFIIPRSQLSGLPKNNTLEITLS